MTAYVFVHFISCLNQFLTSVSRDLVFSASSGSRRIQLYGLILRLADWPLCGIQFADRIESDGTSDMKLVSCLFDYFKYFFMINLFIQDTVK